VAAYLRLYARPERFLSFAVTDNDPLRLLACQRSLAHLGLPLVCSQLIDRRLLGRGNDDRQRFQLLVRLAGAQALIEAASPLVRDICQEQAHSVTPIDEPEMEAETWSSLTKAERTETAYPLELAVNRQSFARLWKQENALFDLPFSYGIGPGLAKFTLSDLAEEAKMVDKLRAFADRNAETLIVAYSDSQYLRRVKRLGADFNQKDQ